MLENIEIQPNIMGFVIRDKIGKLNGTEASSRIQTRISEILVDLGIFSYILYIKVV